MSDPAFLLLAFGVGIAGGGCFFGGLCWTVRRLPAAQRPYRLLAGSFAARVVLLLATAYLVAGDDIFRLACYMTGFLTMRALALNKIHSRLPGRTEGRSHEPHAG